MLYNNNNTHTQCSIVSFLFLLKSERFYCLATVRLFQLALVNDCNNIHKEI